MKDVTTHDISEEGELSGTERPVEIELDLQKSVHMYIRNENERRLSTPSSTLPTDAMRYQVVTQTPNQHRNKCRKLPILCAIMIRRGRRSRG